MDYWNSIRDNRGGLIAILIGVVALAVTGAYVMSKTHQQINTQNNQGVLGVKSIAPQYLIYQRLEGTTVVPHVYDILNRSEVTLPEQVIHADNMIVSDWSPDGKYILASNGGGDNSVYIINSTDRTAKEVSLKSSVLSGFWKDNNTFELQNPNDTSKDILISVDGSVQNAPHDPRTVYKAQNLQVAYPGSNTPFSSANSTAIPTISVNGKNLPIQLASGQYIVGLSNTDVVAAQPASAPATISLYDPSTGSKKGQMSIPGAGQWSTFPDPSSIQVIPNSDSVLISQYNGQFPNISMRILELNLANLQTDAIVQRVVQGIYGNGFIISPDGTNLIYAVPLIEEGQARQNPNKALYIHNIPTGVDTNVSTDHVITFTAYSPTLLYQAFVRMP